MAIKKYRVNLWGTEVEVRSENSKNAIYCALIRNKITLDKIDKLTKVTKVHKADGKELKVMVENVEGKTKTEYAIKLKGI